MKKLLICLLLIPSLGYSATRNIVPRGTGEGYIGLSTKTWAGAYADQFFGDGSNLTGLATDGELAAVAASTAPLKDYANWNTAYGWGAHAGLYLVAPASFTYQAPLVEGIDYLAPAGDGSSLTGVIHSTTSYLADGVSLALTGATFSAKSSSVTLQGNTFNGASQLVKLDALSKLPAVDGSQLTNLPSTSGGAVLASTQTFTGANTFVSSVTISGTIYSSLVPFAWVEFDSTAGPAILASVNISSITYMGTTGQFMVNFDSNFTGTAYASVCSAGSGDSTTIFHCVVGAKYTTGQAIGIYAVYSLGGDISLSNAASHVSVVFYGVR